MCSPGSDQTARRLFLALWPDATERRQLVELATGVAGRRRTPDANLHLTLVFLGATDPARLIAYEAALADLSPPTLELTLDRYGYWPQPRILWLGSSRTPPELYELVAELHSRLRGCGFTPERRAFRAHITLARQHPGPAPTQPLVAPLHWQVHHVTLVESLRQDAGSAYRIVRRWPPG